MRNKFLSALFAIAFVGVMNADCTVKTNCGEKTYKGVSKVSVSAVSSNGMSKITVKDSKGAVLDVFECEGNASASSSCSSRSGDAPTPSGDFCDRVPARFKALLGCE